MAPAGTATSLRNRRSIVGRNDASVWYGWENGLPGPSTSPSYSCAHKSEFFCLADVGGQYYSNRLAQAGSPPDMQAGPKRLDVAGRMTWNPHRTIRRSAKTLETDAGPSMPNSSSLIGLILSEAPHSPSLYRNDLHDVPEKGHFGPFDPRRAISGSIVSMNSTFKDPMCR